MKYSKAGQLRSVDIQKRNYIIVEQIAEKNLIKVTNQLKLEAADGKLRYADVMDVQAILQLIKIIHSSMSAFKSDNSALTFLPRLPFPLLCSISASAASVVSLYEILEILIAMLDRNI